MKLEGDSSIKLNVSCSCVLHYLSSIVGVSVLSGL